MPKKIRRVSEQNEVKPVETTIIAEMKPAANPNQEIKALEVKASVADEIWGQIKDKKINPFAIKEEPISKFFNRVNISPDKCFLTSKVSAAIPMLEGVVASCRLAMEVQDKYFIIARK